MEKITKIFDKVYLRLDENLSPNCVYHNADHTRYVVEKARMLAGFAQLETELVDLVSLGALYHDLGYIYEAADHEVHSCNFARKDLKEAGFSEAQINIVCGMVMATKVPQRPKTELEKIVADADLYYLGTDGFESIGGLLLEELNLNGANLTPERWNALQINFLSTHRYHTDYCKRHLEPIKQAHLAALITTAQQ